MDISSVTATTRVVDILHPATNEPIGLKVTLRPHTSPEVRAADRRWLNEGLRGRKMTAEQIESRGIDILAATVAALEWYQPDGADSPGSFEGSQPAASADIVTRILKKLPWLKEQIDVEAGNKSAFFQS